MCQVAPSGEQTGRESAQMLAPLIGTVPALAKRMRVIKHSHWQSFGLALPSLFALACGGISSLEGGGHGAGAGVAGAGAGGVGAGGVGPVAGAGGVDCSDVACPSIACGVGYVLQPIGCCGTCVPGGGAGAPAGGSGGAAGCSGVFSCPLIPACDPGWTLGLEPDECCPTCLPPGGAGAGGVGGAGGCSAVACPDLACAIGYGPVIEPGDCCRTCVPNHDACGAGQKGYGALRDDLLSQPGATACVKDSDCATIGGFAKCGDVCSLPAVNASLAPDIMSQLTLWATDYCATCTAMDPPCAVPPTPFCEGGQCQLYHAL
ncbi:MAG: hypothetical protein ABI335_10360 [Polyangiaceae bacterium]